MIKGKTTDALMRFLRNKHRIKIGGSKDKRELLNMGYFHGYKGYRFIKKSGRRIPFTKFDELIAIYQFDAELKALFYPNIMLIETALKNYTLDTIIRHSSAVFDSIYANLLNDYKQQATGNNKYKKKMKSRLELKDKIHSAISYNYISNKPVIQHYFHNNNPVPIWAIFEVITFGVFGNFIHCLNKDVRIKIAKSLNLHNTSINQNGRILEDIIFLLTDLRNAVAHNGIVFDCRYKQSEQSARLLQYIQAETSVSNIRFDHIVDYLVVQIYLLKKLGIQKRKLRRLIKRFQTESERLRKHIPLPVYTSIMGSDLRRKLTELSDFL